VIVRTLKTYYWLTKPGIVYGNTVTAAGGFLLAARGQVAWGRLAGMLAGMALVVASAGVVNNYLDRGIDAKMARTKRRALVTGAVSGRAALAYGMVLGVVGAALLARWTNALAVGLAVFGWVMYVAVYGWAKRRTVYGTIVGSLSGAVPPVVGYCAVTNRVDAGAMLVFLLLVLWQMPHFYAIAMYRVKDYAAAGLPVWPVVRGMAATKRQIVWYIGAFLLAVAALAAFGYAGYSYLVVMLLVGAMWLNLGLQGWRAADDGAWARQMFLASLVVIGVLSVMMPVGAVLP
jgi:heme o synthase